MTRMYPRALPSRQLVEMATIGGAHALHMDKPAILAKAREYQRKVAASLIASTPM